MKLLAKSLLFFLISSKKFQAKTKISGFLSFNLSFEIIGIFTPGMYFSCFNLLSSIIKSISFFILKKLSEVVAFAGAPYPTIFLCFFFNFFKLFTTFFF